MTDLILVGAGLANGLLASELLQRRPEVSFVMLERGASLGGNHTWCFHDADLTPAQAERVTPFIAHRWAGQEVRFPHLQRRLTSPYRCIPSSRFAENLSPRLGQRLRLSSPVRELRPDAVVLDNGEELRGTVIDGTGFRASAALTIRFQSFVGHELRLAQPHGLAAPVIMDATTHQDGGYRFTYLLPFDERTVLVEDTGYVDHGRLQRPELERRIAEYARQRGWVTEEVVRTESGVLPITLDGDVGRFWDEARGVPNVGLAGGFFHPTTGYSLPDAVRVAELVAGLRDLSSPAVFAALREHARRRWREQSFYRGLNRMLFLAGRPEARWQVMERFYRLPQPLIEHFYAGRLTLADKARILMGKPPVPLGEGLRALLSHPASGRSH